MYLMKEYSHFLHEFCGEKKFVIEMSKDVKISSAGTLKLLHYNHKFIIAVFVIRDNFIKDYMITLPGLEKKFVVGVNSLPPCSL